MPLVKVIEALVWIWIEVVGIPFSFHPRPSGLGLGRRLMGEGRQDSGIIDLASEYLCGLDHGLVEFCLVILDALREMVVRGGEFLVVEMMMI